MSSIHSDGTVFLEQVTEKLKDRIAEVQERLAQGQREVENMHDYYWENYTEMDQYGYEDFDNQQALLQQVGHNQETQVLLQAIPEYAGLPVFGRVDFTYEGEEEPESFYIGIGNFAERAGMIPLIYDWRAPVSGLFYDFDKGLASYEAPAGVLHGEINAKWQYKIRGSRMVYAFENDMKIDDEILKRELGENGDVQLKNIVRTIQKEQNAIIRNTKDKILVIQGAAGSGKTSVALHRIAYLLYHDRRHLKSSNILILSPNSVFADYISHILPELGEENIQEMSFDLFAYRELKEIVPDCEDRYDELEQRMCLPDMEALRRFRAKQSAEFIGQVEGFLAELEDGLMEFHDLEWKQMKKSEEELIELFYLKFQDTPLLARMDAVMEYVVDEFETLSGRSLSEEEREAVREKFQRLYVTRDIYRIYNGLMERIGYPVLPDLPYESRKLAYEDVFPMLYLKYRLCGNLRHRNIKHLVIDEMQDYSYLQYVILEHLFSCRMTILGDKAQTMDETARDVLDFLPKIFGKDIRKIVMNKSYRNTLEIARYAESITGVRDLELFERHGREVEERSFGSEEEAFDAIRRVLDSEGDAFETTAVLTRTESQALEAYAALKAGGLAVSYIDRDSSRFRRGWTVTTFYLAKGLEFDRVFTLTDNEESALARQADYICATRALHELYVYRVDKKGPKESQMN